MGLDDVCLGWQEADLLLPGCSSSQEQLAYSLPVHLKQILCVKQRLVILTKEGRLGVLLKNGDINYLLNNKDEETQDAYQHNQPAGQVQDQLAGKIEVINDQQTNIYSSYSLHEFGRIEWISKCSDSEDSILCVTESKTVWKVEIPESLGPGQDLNDVISVSREESPGQDGINQVVSTSRHHINVDNRGAVWSKGEVPYCGLIHSSQSYQRIPYLSGYQVTQLETGSDFTACIAKPKQVVSPDTPTEDELDGEAAGKADLFNTTHDSLSSQNSCPLGIKINSSPVSKSARPNAAKSLSANLSYSILSESPLNDNFKEEKDSSEIFARTETSESALFAEFNHELDEPIEEDDPSNNNTAETVPLSRDSSNAEIEPLLDKVSLTTTLIQKDAINGRSSPVSLDDIRLSLSAKSSSEPPPANSVHSQVKVRRSSSLTLSVPQLTTTRTSPTPRTLNCSNSKVAAPGVNRGEDLWRDEVWVWGEGGRGQLGQGDMLARPNPVPVQGIHNQFITKISAGYQHMLMLTGAGKVFGWGHNSSGQSNPGDKLAVVLFPSHIHLPRGETARDIQAVGNMSFILSHTGNLYYAGQTETIQKKHKLQCISLTDCIPSVSAHHPCSIYSTLAQSTHHPCSIYSTLAQSTASNSATKHLYMMVNFESGIQVVAGRLAAAEKQLLDKVETVANLISQLESGSPGQKKVDVGSPVGRVWYALIKCRNLLAHSLHSYHTQQQQQTDVRWNGLLSDLSWWVDACSEFGYSIGNCISRDCLMLDSDQAQHQHNIVTILLQQFGWKQQNIKGQIELEQLLLELYNLNLPYLGVVESLLPSVGPASNTILFKQSIATLKSLQQTLRQQKCEAESTREFWEMNTDARINSCRNTNQRLILDSKNTPSVSLASAFSNHRFILLSDVLIDIGYNKISVHPLCTVWVDALPISQGMVGTSKPQISLTMPEGTKVLVCSGVDTRTQWLKKLNEAVYRELTGVKFSLTTTPHIPITRAVTFTYTRGELKGCEYNGAMTQGRMHGKGRLSSPDGAVYTGSLRNDIKHGWGELKLDNGTVKSGTWMEGKLTGLGSLKFPDGSDYEGDLVDGEPHGHGIMKSGRYVGDGATMYTGSWIHGTRHGYGVLENTNTGERYMGSWNEGLRHGQGCVVNSDGIYYEGNFVTDRLSGPGIIIFEDGAIYEGEFCGAGEFYGSGNLTTKAEKFQGTFYGTYSDGMKFNGTVYRHKNPEDYDMDTEAERVTRRYTVPSSEKWKPIFMEVESMLSVNGKSAWENLSVQFHQNKIGYLEGRGQGKERGVGQTKWQGFDILETIPKVAKTLELTWCNYCDILDYLVTANTCPIHPIHQVVALLVNSFNFSYGGLHSHPTILPHAKDELEDVSLRLYSILRNLFPCLPALAQDGGQVWLPKYSKDQPDSGQPDPATSSDIMGEDESVLITPDHLLFPLILPSIYPALFNLYIQKEDKNDREYWHRITRWNKHTDAALLTFFDVDISTWDLKLDRRSRDTTFLQAIYTLQRLKTTFTPAEKLDVIVDMFKAITNEKESAGGSFTWNMDVLLPVCMYIVVRARVLQLGAELQLVNDFMLEHLRQGLQGITFTTLHAAYTQIRRESVFIN